MSDLSDLTTGEAEAWRAGRDAAAAECVSLLELIERKGINVDTWPLRAAAAAIRAKEPPR